MMRKFAAIFVVLSMAVSCATTQTAREVRYPNAVTPEARQRFDAAESLYLAGRMDEADASFASFIEEIPYNQLTDEARFRRGEIAFSKGSYYTAIDFYSKAYGEIQSPHVVPKARFKKAMAYYKLDRHGDALSELKAIDRSHASSLLRYRIDSLGIRASEALDMPPGAAVLWHLYAIDDLAEYAFRDQIPEGEKLDERKSLAAVEAWMADPAVTLEIVRAMPISTMKGKRSGGFVEYKLAYLEHVNGNTKVAEKILKGYVTTYPRHEYYQPARMLMTQLGGVIGEGADIKVGVILPLSGRYRVYGESVLHGIECAAGIYEPCAGPSGVKILVRDSGSSAVGAVQAVDELAGEGVIAIIGPLVSGAAQAAAPRAQSLGVPMITLSQHEGIANVGNYIFRNSISTASEISNLVDYAAGVMKMNRFFVLYPNNKKGVEYKDLFTSDVNAHGGKVVGAQAYNPNQMEFASELRGRGVFEHGFEFQRTKGSYQAIFIPDSYWAVSYIAPTIALMGVEDVQLLGISRWDDPKLVERGGDFVEGAIFVQSFYKDAPLAWVSSFISNFKRAYGIDPTTLEALGYDSMRLIIDAAVKDGARGRDSMQAVLARTKGYPGVAGSISFDANGEVERKFSVLTIKDGAIRPAE